MATPKKKQQRKTGEAAPRAPDDSQRNRDLDALAVAMPDPGAAFRAAVLAGVTEYDLVTLGQSFGSDDILESTPAFISGIIEQPLTAQQRATLLGYSPEQVALLIHETLRLRDLNLSYDQRAKESITKLRADLQRAITAGVSLRDMVERTLRRLVPLATPLRTALDAAHGTAETGAALAKSLRGLAGVTRDLRGGTDVPTRAVYEGMGVGDGLIEELGRAADDVEAKERLAQASTGTRIDQRQLDYQDGVVLSLMSSLWHTFQYGHERNATIVVPALGRLKRLVRKGNGRSQLEKPSPSQPVAPVSPQS